MRAVAWTGDALLVASGSDLTLLRPGHAPEPRLQLAAGADFAFVATRSGGRALVGELTAGAIVELDIATGQRVTTFAGPRNAFDAAPLPSGDVLLNANPAWPQPGAHAGVWLAGPGRQPRELLALVGPSGPLLLLPNGDLVVAELGPVVPPPPGAARLLRFAATDLQQAIASSGTLTANQAIANVNGWSGLFDLALDDRGRIHASDPAQSRVLHTAPGGLAPVGSSIDLGNGQYGLWLAFDDRGTAPFAAFQPGERAPALLTCHSDFATRFAVTRVVPTRPTLRADVAAVLPAGATATFALADGPPLGLAALVAGATAPTPEHVARTVGGIPLCLAMPTGAAVELPPFLLDAHGAGRVTFTNPGGFALPLTVQAACLGTTGTEPTFATSNPLALHLLP
ncbi:MAG: hypothetical protein KDE27_11435 [Planctomycetes bacterium]|nr:hypothetical protein [Planctomycetota bacterium]